MRFHLILSSLFLSLTATHQAFSAGADEEKIARGAPPPIKAPSLSSPEHLHVKKLREIFEPANAEKRPHVLTVLTFDPTVLSIFRINCPVLWDLQRLDLSPIRCDSKTIEGLKKELAKKKKLLQVQHALDQKLLPRFNELLAHEFFLDKLLQERAQQMPRKLSPWLRLTTTVIFPAP